MGEVCEGGDVVVREVDCILVLSRTKWSAAEIKHGNI